MSPAGRLPAIAAALLCAAPGPCAWAAQPATAGPLLLERAVELGAVEGRIDHLALDVRRQRLFIAELGNGSVGVVDLAGGRVLRRVPGLHEPQGVAFSASTGTLYVASGGDGTVRAYAGDALAPAGEVDVGDDADNLRLDDKAGRLFVGHGRGALTSLELAPLRPRDSIRMPAHPESFQLETDGTRAYVNLPDAGLVAVIDRDSGRQIAAWPLSGRRANFPMALDEEARRLYVVFRQPAWIEAYDVDSGREAAGMATCGDADDVFVDRRRHRLYVVCGEGRVQVLGIGASGLQSLGSVATRAGARTGLYSAELDRLFVALRRSGGAGAAVWVLRPTDGPGASP